MIIYYSSWGLGNELLQYTYLRSVAKNEEKIFCLGGMDELADSFDLNDPNFYIYSPSRFQNNIIRIIIFPLLCWLAKNRIFNFLAHRRDKNGYFLQTPTKTIGLIPINIVRTGYFQSETLFIWDRIKFTIKDKYVVEALKVFNSFPKHQTKVFIHIRRGDFLKEIYNNKKGVSLPFSYYSKAIKLIEDEVSLPFFIFLSDDYEYVKQAFRHIDDSDKFISTKHPAVDLHLMALCEYGVCSNSTFSWWGSYLMKNSKKVFFPKYWYGWKTKDESHPGIQPSWSEVIDVN